MHPPAFLLTVATLCVGACAQSAHQKLLVAICQSIHATIQYEIETTRFAVSRWLVFLPELPELPSQTEVRLTDSVGAKPAAECSALARPVRFWDHAVAHPVAPSRLSITLEVDAVLWSRRLAPLQASDLPPKVTPLSSIEAAFYQAPSRTFDFQSQAFVKWLKHGGLLRADNEAPLDLAARIITVLRSDFAYRFDMLEDKSVSLVCARAAADCAGFSYLLIAAMRANRVPARALIGRLAKPRRGGSGPMENAFDQPHVRVEVFIADLGWVPIDPTFAVQNQRRSVASFIGNDDGDMLVLHVDPDLQLPFPDQQRIAGSLQVAPYYWAYGEGPFDGFFGPTGWDLKSVSAVK
jgi:transglutaminase-like putative cysteine protease